ncbi:MAG: hypothetical protein DMF66_08795 [Acidobacteria bacterium]|nr:MAG: hypothetical protein DMF66_08795 [Acidobacteriota bacterium]
MDPQPDHRAPAEVRDGEPYIGTGDIRSDGSIDFESCRRVSVRALEKQQSNFRIEQGDILFGKIGTIGQPQFLPQPANYALNANTILIKPIGSPTYVLELLRSQLIERQIAVQIHSTTQPAFGIQRVRSMLVPIPHTEEQERIAIALNTHQSRIITEEASRNKLIQIKKGLMHDLLTGRVRVPITRSEVVAV